MITDSDREAADKAFDVAFRGDTDGIDDAMAELFAQHRLQARWEALEEALQACRVHQYSPAPYTDITAAIRNLITPQA